MEYHNVFTYKNLYNAYLHCIKNVRWKTETQRYISQDVVLIRKLYNELRSKTYKANRFKEFDIMERGKERHISAHTLRDRIVQRCLCDQFLVPVLSRRLIYDCGATIKGKGILFSQKRVNTHLHKYYRHHGSKGYCLTIDIHHYFESISHDILKSKLRKVIPDNDLFHMMEMLIDNFAGESGLGLGSQISQICALYYLSDLDHFIKEQLKAKYYGRYMDDAYIISDSKDYLYNCLRAIDQELRIIGLTLNKKTKIHKLRNGFTFTKIRYILTDTGKVLHLITTKTFKSMMRKVRKGIDLSVVVPSWLAYLKKFNCYKRLDNISKRIYYIDSQRRKL